MSRFVPWALVALCFALGVASRSISDSFVVFVPALQSAFDASRSAIAASGSVVVVKSRNIASARAEEPPCRRPDSAAKAPVTTA